MSNNYYNPNVGKQDGKLRNSRVRDYHEPIVMLNYGFDISSNTKLAAAASFRFGKNGYSALTWTDGPDPRPDYYRYLPSFYTNRILQLSEGIESSDLGTYNDLALRSMREWITDPSKSQMDYDNMFRMNYNRNKSGASGIYMIEERHTDQRDFNFAANIAHTFRNQSVLRGGLTARINRTEYYDQVKDLLGADYWLDVDKFALRDNGNYNPLLSQNDLDYYLKHGEARRVGEGDKFSYDYYANLRQAQVWAQYYASFGGFTMSLGGEVGYTAMWRDGRLRKGLFANNSLGKSKTLDYLTYKLKGEFSYRFSGAHAIDANVAYMVNPPQFRDAFVSARTRNTTTPGLDSEKVLGVDLSYNLNLPWITARVSGYYTSVADQSKVISYYDDTQSSFTNFAMSGIDKRYYGLEVGVVVPIWGGISFNGALSLGDYRYTSDANFTQTRDNSEEVLRGDKVLWDDLYVESTPQTALNLGLSYRGPRNWFASVDFNYYDRIYLSMNPARRTRAGHGPAPRRGGTAPRRREIHGADEPARSGEIRLGLYAQPERRQELVHPPHLPAGLQPRGEEYPQRPDDPHGRLRTDAPFAPYLCEQGGCGRPADPVLRAVRFEVLLPAGDDLLPECIFPLLIRYDDYEKDISVMCRAGRDVCGYGVL